MKVYLPDPRMLLGFRKNGQPIYLVQGGDGTDDDDSGEDEKNEDEDDTEDDDKEDEKDSKDESELKKAIRRRDRALREKRALERELQEFRDKDKKKDDPDPVKVANTRLIRAEVRTQLASAGITEREDQKVILEILDLEGVSVGDDGDVDVDEIEDRIAELRRIFGGRATKRTPRVDTRDRGKDKDTNTDPDAARYRQILGRR